MWLFGQTSRTPQRIPLLLLLLLVFCADYSDGGRLTGPQAGWGIPLELEPEPELDLELDSVRASPSFDSACSLFDPLIPCNVSCTLTDLDVLSISPKDYSKCTKPELLTIAVNVASPTAVLRLCLSDASKLAVNESLTVLDSDGTLAVLTKSLEIKSQWVASQWPELTLEYQQSDDHHDNPDRQIQLTVVAYNQTQQDRMFTTEMAGVLSAPEQTNWTGSPDYAVNTVKFWHLNLQQVASHVNFTVTSLDLDPAAGDVLIIGSGKGPYDTEPTAELLTGKFSKRRYHVPGGEAFIYFMSRDHATPRTPFEVSYIAEPLVEPTTPMPTTTDKNHPPTPSSVDFLLDCFVTGMDPQRFLNVSDTATSDLQNTLEKWANYYAKDHDEVDSWRPVHPDDIQFTAWLMCDYTSGWTMSDPNCVRVTWYIELLRNDGNWAFQTSDLRGIISDYGDDINEDLGYKFSLTVDQVNTTWWWAIAIALVPLAMLAFLLVMWISSSSTHATSALDENADHDLDDLIDEVENKLDIEVKTIPAEKDLDKIFTNKDYKDYDPELHGPHHHRSQQARFAAQPPVPLKSALKAPKAAPTTYTNAAFVGDNGGGGDGQPAAPTPAQPTLPDEPASSKPTEPLILLQEEGEQQEEQVPGFELPRVDRLVQRAPVAGPKLFSVNLDGTGTEIDAARPGENVLQLDDHGSSDEDRTGQDDTSV